MVINQYHPLKGTAEGEPSNRFVRATGNEFDGRELLLGQLVYVRKGPLERNKFDAAAAPALCWMAVRFRTIVIRERVLRARLRKC